MTNEEPTRERKERVLHTRISEQLAEDIRAIADDLRVPVSNLVRNVLEEAFDAVERVSGDVSHHRRGRDRGGRARERALPPLPDPRARARTGARRRGARRSGNRGHAAARRRWRPQPPPRATTRSATWSPGSPSCWRRRGAARAPAASCGPASAPTSASATRGPLGVYVAESAIERPA